MRFALQLACIAQWLLAAGAFSLGSLAPRASKPDPLPISVPPSQSWDGDDGPWSSFTIQVGTPAQDVRVFISTASSNTLVVRSDACLSTDGTCQFNRGMLFNPNSSTSWQQKGYYEINVEQNLGLFSQGVFGNDTVTLGIQGSGGPTLQDQIVSAFTDTGLYLGMFGANPTSTNFTPTDQDRPSYLSTLREQNMIPSLSFGYTAGNQYRLKQVFGSLILGGYDSSLFFPEQTLSVPMGPNVGRELMVGIQSISSKNENGTGALLMRNGIMAYVDTTIPMFWLPETVCKQFEDAFGLTPDSKTGLYFVNNALHEKLTSQNASVTFTLGAAADGGQTINVTLPYNSFDLIIKPPALNVAQSTKYFPLRKAANETQYTLGRAFFQEAYLTVDWERRNFSIAPCAFQSGAQQTLVAINGTSSGSSTSSSSSSSSSTSGGSSSTGRTVGIAVGVVVGVLAILGAIVVYLLLKRRKRSRAADAAAKAKADETNSAIRQGFKPEMGTGIDNQRYEMAGSDPGSSRKADDPSHPIPEWVNEKAQFPGGGDRSEIAEADGSNSSAVAELVGAGGKVLSGRPVHEMFDPSTHKRYELPANQPGELQGSTPGSSMPNSPTSDSSQRRSSRGFRFPISKPNSPLISQASSSPHPSPVTDSSGSRRPARSRASRFSLLHSLRRNNRDSSGPSEPSDAENATASENAQGTGEQSAMRSIPLASPSSHGTFSPVSKRDTFERSETPELHSPISPQTPGPGHGGLFERLKRRS